MKKIIVGLVSFLLWPFICHAATVEVTNYLVDAQILNNGDVLVKELMVADGSFNWFERDLVYANTALNSSDNFANNLIYNATDISDVSIKAKIIDKVSFASINDEDFEPFELTTIAQNKDRNLYTKVDILNGYRYRMYYATNNAKVAFYITYTIKNAVVLHNDVAELYWNFVPEGFDDTLNNVEIKVHLISPDNSDTFRYWAHGNLSGEVTNPNNQEVYAQINQVFAGEGVDIRLTFSKDQITDTSTIKTSNVDALDEIIEVETLRANEANALRNNLIKKRNFCLIYTIILLLAIAILSIITYLLYGKSPKSKYYSKYNREFIDDYNVEVIDYLMKRQITPNALSASIMNLIYKKNISVKQLTNDKKKKEYEFTLENTNNLSPNESILIDFLFDTVGKNSKDDNAKKIFTTKQLKSYANGTKTCSDFIKSYTNWKQSVLNAGIDENFYITFNTPKIMGVIILIFSLFLIMYIVSNGIDLIISYITIILGLIYFIYALIVYKKTPKGSEHYARWKAFKNFLNDFGSFELKELPEIILWERYLVYATIFGLADKVEKSMNVKINEININDYDITPTLFYINIAPAINSSINNALNSAYNRQSANYANTHSRMSSGGGFGGGFSSGGGFGGGGGGGRFG